MEQKRTFLNSIAAFLRKEDGAVTVDWVVLTGAIVTLAILVCVPILNQIVTEGNATGTAVVDAYDQFPWNSQVPGGVTP